MHLCGHQDNSKKQVPVGHFISSLEEEILLQVGWSKDRERRSEEELACLKAAFSAISV